MGVKGDFEMKEIVSICVVTYNNAKYVEETLDSIKNQTYKDIELIISDDNSTDDTLLKVNNWVDKNKDRFVNVKVITSDKNTGVTANCNRAVKASSGQFVKTFGDDILKPTYVEVCVDFFNSTPDAEVFCTDMEYFYPEGKFEFLQKDIDYDFFKLSAKEQYHRILKFYLPRYPTPSVIYKRIVFEKVGYFDESIPLWEDGPMYFKLAKNGIKVYMINDKLVDYRLLPTSASNHRTKFTTINACLYTLKYICPGEIRVNPMKAILRYMKHLFLLTKYKYFM